MDSRRTDRVAQTIRAWEAVTILNTLPTPEKELGTSTPKPEAGMSVIDMGPRDPSQNQALRSLIIRALGEKAKTLEYGPQEKVKFHFDDDPRRETRLYISRKLLDAIRPDIIKSLRDKTLPSYLTAPKNFMEVAEDIIMNKSEWKENKTGPIPLSSITLGFITDENVRESLSRRVRDMYNGRKALATRHEPLAPTFEIRNEYGANGGTTHITLESSVLNALQWAIEQSREETNGHIERMRERALGQSR